MCRHGAPFYLDSSVAIMRTTLRMLSKYKASRFEDYVLSGESLSGRHKDDAKTKFNFIVTTELPRIKRGLLSEWS